MTQETNNLAADLWALADLLRGDFKQSQYGRVILPFALLRRLECVLESSKSAVLVEAAKVEKMAIAEEAKEKLLLRATSGLSFFNTSPMDLSTLGESGIKANLERYIQCFSKDAREIAEDLVRQDEQINRLNRDVFSRAVEIGTDADRREWAMTMLLAARAIERIGDNAVDIGEQVVFLVTGLFREFEDASHPGEVSPAGR